MSRSRYILDEQIGFLLRKANQRHRTIFSSLIQPKVAPAQFSALVRLSTHGPIHQNELGRLVAMDSATITGVVNRLSQKGWVRATADLDDARLSMIELTEEGSEVVGQLMARAKKISSTTLAPLSADEAKTLLDLLKRISE